MDRIALIEDNEDNRLLFEALLEDVFEVTSYVDGSTGLVGVFDEPMPQLVLLDISLPGMDGTEVLQKIRDDARGQGLPVVALTAHAMLGDERRFLNLGFDAYISKPVIDDEAMIQTIRKLLDR